MALPKVRCLRRGQIPFAGMMTLEWVFPTKAASPHYTCATARVSVRYTFSCSAAREGSAVWQACGWKTTWPCSGASMNTPFAAVQDQVHRVGSRVWDLLHSKHDSTFIEQVGAQGRACTTRMWPSRLGACSSYHAPSFIQGCSPRIHACLQVMNAEAWEQHRRAGLRHRPRPRDLARVILGYAGVLAWVVLLSAAVGIYDITLVRVSEVV